MWINIAFMWRLRSTQHSVLLQGRNVMPATVLIGAQWGDEGKGRVADALAAEADVVARFAGGDNAGHTVRVGEQTFKLHLIPSGILHPNVTCILGAGTVVN